MRARGPSISARHGSWWVRICSSTSVQKTTATFPISSETESSRGCSAKASAERSVIRRLFLHRIDHQHWHRTLAHLELQPELPVDGVRQRQGPVRLSGVGPSRAAWAGTRVAGAGRKAASDLYQLDRREEHREVVRALEAGLVFDRHAHVAAGEAAQILRELLPRHVP